MTGPTPRPTYFVERLTLLTWWRVLFPELLKARFGGSLRHQCYVFDGSGLAMIVAKASARLLGACIERLRFSTVDVRDDDGLSVRLLLAYRDLAEVQRTAVGHDAFQELVRRDLLAGRQGAFLSKNIAAIDLYRPGTVWRALNLVQVASWKTRQIRKEGGTALLLLERIPWLAALEEYASRWGVGMIPVQPASNFKDTIRRTIPPEAMRILRQFKYGVLKGQRPLAPRRPVIGSTEQSEGARPAVRTPSIGINGNRKPRVAVEYYGQLNLNRPELHSDLFFWQQSHLEGDDVVVSFSAPSDPLDSDKLKQMRQHGIHPVVLHPGAATVPGALRFTDSQGRGAYVTREIPTGTRTPEAAWLSRQLSRYQGMTQYWTNLFDAFQIRVFVTWYKYDATHCAIADALQSLGGVTAIYQRAYESHPCAETAIDTDVYFGFSPSGADVERLSGSRIKYHVATGYLGDHRFRLLRPRARKVRETLHQRGAQRILAFFDENTVDDGRWYAGHHFTQENYAFLLEKVLSEPWLGLLIKPKNPRTLRRRLGPVAHLLEQAEATGRCYIFEEHGIQGSHVPAAAALASDVAIHGHLYAGSAGIDAALAGIPTLMLDREGWHVSPFYRLGVGKVVFRDWESLWEACSQHWTTHDGLPGLGDWSPMLGELDPFRDGRAAERMGTYILWLLEGFKAGLDRDTVMADASARYIAQWGSDKVTEVGAGSARRI